MGNKKKSYIESFGHVLMKLDSDNSNYNSIQELECKVLRVAVLEELLLPPVAPESLDYFSPR